VAHWNKALEALSNIKAQEVIGTRKHGEYFILLKDPPSFFCSIFLDSAHQEWWDKLHFFYYGI
jgi:hypothetical protein